MSDQMAVSTTKHLGDSAESLGTMLSGYMYVGVGGVAQSLIR